MREFFDRYLQHYGRYTLCLITTAIYNLTFNWELGFSILFFYAFCYTLIFALVLTRNKWLFAVGLPVLFLPSALAVFFYKQVQYQD